jgi:carbohydrate-binding DOMON domain-containing protein
MKRREYLTGVAGVGALTAVGATAGVAGASNHTIGTIEDPVGDDDGPGGYTYPTSDEFKDGVYDMTGVTIADEGDGWSFEVGIDGPVEDSYDFGSGFGVQVFQLYVRDPNAPSDAPTATEGRAGSGVTFDKPYHYRVHVTGNGSVVEDASAAGAFAEQVGDTTVISEDVTASGDSENSTITFTVPKDAIGGGNIGDKEIALCLFGQDGFGVGGVRTNFLPEQDTYAFGLGDNGVINAPRAIDVLDPEGVFSQYDALSFTEEEMATIPLFRVGDVIDTSGGSGGGSDGGSGGQEGGFSLPATAPDPIGDDDGPGGYTYPTSDEFKDGVYDMTGVTVDDEGDAVSFEVGIDGPVEDSYDFGSGFGVQVFQLYLQDPNASGDLPTATEGRAGSGVTFDEPYHYRVHVTGNGSVVEDASAAGAFAEQVGDTTVISEDVTASGDSENSTITFTVPKDAIGGGENLGEYKFSLLLFGQDGFGVGGVRTNFLPEADTYAFGLGDNGVINAPRAIDVLDPAGTFEQYEALSFTEEEMATVPLLRMDEAFEPAQTGGEDGGESEGPADADNDGVPDEEDFAPENGAIQDPPSETVPGGEGPPQNADGDGQGLAEDVDGDGDTDVDDVRSLLFNRNSDAVQENRAYFDFDGDGRITIKDAAELYNRIFR